MRFRLSRQTTSLVRAAVCAAAIVTLRAAVVEPGSFVLASAEGVSVFDREGKMAFAKETAVQLFEVTHDKNVVWKFGTEAFAGRKPGSLEPKTGNIEQRIIGLQWLGEEKK